ncbi:hypothetical protein BBK14_32070 [Parafrankia soli]|uniref:Uncharacterized protein n=2 Tax=Parafrankia soli TaxID=2599596 RepID=A0A1S1R9J9_9ACTN|nr:hypothetical protein BBK14_32070 [Parafrankia soli]
MVDALVARLRTSRPYAFKDLDRLAVLRRAKTRALGRAGLVGYMNNPINVRVWISTPSGREMTRRICLQFVIPWMRDGATGAEETEPTSIRVPGWLLLEVPADS